MSRYVEFTLGDGSKVLLETDEREHGVVKASRESDTAKQAAETFEQGVQQAHKSALVVLTQILADSAPDEVEITFGLKATGELGGAIVLAKAGFEANYSVKMTWKKPENKSNGAKS